MDFFDKVTLVLFGWASLLGFCLMFLTDDSYESMESRLKKRKNFKVVLSTAICCAILASLVFIANSEI